MFNIILQPQMCDARVTIYELGQELKGDILNYITILPPTKTQHLKDSNFNPKWLRKFVSLIFTYRYAISLIIAICIVGLGLFLYLVKNWSAKDASQVCTGFFIVITLFYAALNFEFSNSKMKQDYKAARELLTYNSAMDYQKSPMRDYWKTLTNHEDEIGQFTEAENPDPEKFHLFLKGNLEVRIAVVGLLNYLESLCCAINKGLIDKDFIQNFFGTMFKSYYKEYYFYIKYRQDKGREKYGKATAWVVFTSFVEELNDETQKPSK